MELLQSAAALDQLARDLFVNHMNYLGEPVVEWTAIPLHRRTIYVEVAARTLRMITERTPGTTDDALFHLANVLGRADMRPDVVTGLRPTHGKVIGGFFPKDAA